MPNNLGNAGRVCSHVGLVLDCDQTWICSLCPIDLNGKSTWHGISQNGFKIYIAGGDNKTDFFDAEPAQIVHQTEEMQIGPNEIALICNYKCSGRFHRVSSDHF